MNAPPRDFASNVDTMTDAISTAIDLALDVLNRPTFASRLSAVTSITAAVDQCRAIAIEGGNPIRAEVSILLEVLGHIESERQVKNDTRAEQFCMLGGMLLPMVRQNMFATMKLKERRPATTDHDFKRGRG